MKILVSKKTNKKYLIERETESFYTPQGVIAQKYLESSHTTVTSSSGDEFFLYPASPVDIMEFFERGPQVINHKDSGLIITKTGIHKQSNILDAGGGSGMLCSQLALVSQHVTVYETNPEHYAIIDRNIKKLGLANITLEQRNIYEGIDDTNLDVITLDVPEPWQAFPHIITSLRQGGYCVIYLPNLTQVQQCVEEIKKTPLVFIELIEAITRNWVISQKQLRPEFQMLGHTGFLLFLRCLK